VNEQRKPSVSVPLQPTEPWSRREFLRAGSLVLAGALAPGCREHKQSFPPVTGSTSAERAVNAARRFAGTTLTLCWEAGDQAQDPLRFSGPLWEKLTGVRINVIEAGIPIETFRRVMAEHRAKTGVFDAAMVAPSWLPSLVEEDVLEPLDDYVEHYMVRSDLEDFLPLYQSLGHWNGRRYGLFDDGDTLLLYYRRDLFADAKNQRDFAARYGRPLGDPRQYGWREFIDAAQFFTNKFAPDLYGIAPFTRSLRWGWFQALLRANGGQFFDPQTMAPGVTAEPGLRTMKSLAELDRFMPPGVTDAPEPTPLFSAYLSGRAAMASFWPPLGRWAEAYGQARVGGAPRSLIAGKNGYALLPGGHTEMALGWMLSVLTQSRQKESAYLFLQWLSSPEISLQRVMLPYALRDPYRQSHVDAPAYRALWPNASAYLETLKQAAGHAYLDLTIPGAPDYEDAFYKAASEVRLGADVATAMRRMAAEWETITDHYGRRHQRAAYAEFLRRAGAVVPATSSSRHAWMTG
jgi:multiple sugar transport system substrate-binding protein